MSKENVKDIERLFRLTWGKQILAKRKDMNLYLSLSGADFDLDDQTVRLNKYWMKLEELLNEYDLYEVKSDKTSLVKLDFTMQEE